MISIDNVSIATADFFFRPLGDGYVAHGLLFANGNRGGYWGNIPANGWAWELQRLRTEGGFGPVARGTAPTMAEAISAAEAVALAEMKTRRGAA